MRRVPDNKQQLIFMKTLQQTTESVARRNRKKIDPTINQKPTKSSPTRKYHIPLLGMFDMVVCTLRSVLQL